MAWYGERAVYGISSLPVFAVAADIVPEKKFKNYDEAISWFNTHLKEPVSIWFNDKDKDENKDPAGKEIYQTVSLKKFQELYRRLTYLHYDFSHLPGIKEKKLKVNF